MKNISKSFGIIALIAVFGFSMITCGGDDGGDGDEDGNYTVIGTSVPGNSLKDKLNWLRANAQSDTSYTITVDKDEKLKDDIYTLSEDECNVLAYTGKNNVTVLLTGGKTVIVSWLPFEIGSGVTLVLEKITIQASIKVNGALETKTGAKITGSQVSLSSNSIFTMNGGEISGSQVSLSSNSTFTMNDGKIYGYEPNRMVTGSKTTFTMNGGEIYNSGGVYINGTFTMNGGKIYGNTFSNGGGVAVSGTFIMTGGEISGNSAKGSTSLETINSYGGGVYVSAGTFTMSGGTISGNTAGGLGGGVFMANSVDFTMSGGTISGNISYFMGGGVYNNGNTITMTGGTISGNIVYGTGGGGGIYLSSSSTLTKTGGTITGYASDPQNGNVAKKSDGTVLDNAGHAVYTTSGRHRETTAGPTVNIYSSKSGSEGGWE